MLINPKEAKMATRAKPMPPTKKPIVEAELVQCPYCHRSFNSQRITFHENICKSVVKKKRKPYDPVKHRWSGTANEPAIPWIKQKPALPPRLNQTDITTSIGIQEFPKIGRKKASFTPTGSITTDGRIQCPACNRKFNQQAAERHIPFCTAKAAEESK